MDSRSRRPARRALAMCCLLLAVGTMIPVDGVAAARATRLSLQSTDKVADHARLAELNGIIEQLRINLGQDPTNTRTQSKLNAAMAEYELVSARLGGAKAPVLATNPAAPGESLGGGPPAPPNCVSSTATFSNSTPVTIPAVGANTVTSTIVVSGTGTYLYDVDAITNITHSFCSDLDITVTSPAGTIVTLTTDNAGGNDNVWSATRWDDDANPAGAVPYTNNDGVTTDTLYANLTNNPNLVPEEAMGAFIGEDPNGTWTLTVADQFDLDGGSFTWSLDVTTLPAPPLVANTMAANPTPVVIPTTISTTTSTINVAGAGTSILDVDVVTNITHTFNGDIDMTLTSPAGTIVTLTTDNGSGFDNVFNGTTWDDDANPGGSVPSANNPGVASDHVYANLTLASPLVPEEALGAFVGEDPNGTWTLTISDDATGDGGEVTWALDIDTAMCMAAPLCQLTCPADITTTATDLNGAVVNYPPPTASNCVNVVCMPPAGSTFPVGTTVVTCTGDDDVPGATKTTEGGPMPCAESFDGVVAPALPTGWVAANASGPAPLWVTSSAPASFGVDTAPNAAFVDDPGTISDKRLDSAPIAVVSPTATMTFRRNHIFEGTSTFFDGMVLEISINGGPFQDILDAGGSFAVGGYGGVISSSFSNPLAGRSAFVSNSGGYQTTTVNLPAAADGFNVVFRWRMGSDSSVSATGVAIDSITTTGTNCGGGGGGGSSCQFNVTVTIPFDACCIDDASGDIFRHVVASVPPTSPLYGYWEYEVAATAEIFAGIGNHVAYRPGLSIIIDDNDDPAVYCHAEIDFPRRKCRVQVRDITTGRNFVLRDRNINNNTCTAAPPPDM